MQRKIKDLSKQDRRFIAEYIKQVYLPEKLGFDKLSEISECFAKSYDQLNDSAEAKMLAGQQGLQKLKQKFIKARLDKIKEMIDDCFENKENLDIEYICDYVFNYDDRVEFIKEERNEIKVEKQQEKK